MHGIENIKLNKQLPDRWLGRGGSIDWPLQSPDLTTYNSFCGVLWEMRFTFRQYLQRRTSLRIEQEKRLQGLNNLSAICPAQSRMGSDMCTTTNAARTELAWGKKKLWVTVYNNMYSIFVWLLLSSQLIYIIAYIIPIHLCNWNLC
jgi:hypothetical protein